MSESDGKCPQHPNIQMEWDGYTEVCPACVLSGRHEVNALKPKQYTRKTFGVEAIQVTAENIEAVARWCGGVVIVSETTLHKFIRLDESNAAYRRHITAFPGDWVALGSNGFRVYQKGSFESMFDEVSGNEDKVAKIEEFVRKAMVSQDAATYNGESSAGMSIVCHEIALQIAQIV